MRTVTQGIFGNSIDSRTAMSLRVVKQSSQRVTIKSEQEIANDIKFAQALAALRLRRA